MWTASGRSPRGAYKFGLGVQYQGLAIGTLSLPPLTLAPAIRRGVGRGFHTRQQPQIASQEVVVDMRCTAVFQRVPEGYIAFIEEFPGANTQGASLEEARTNLREAISLVVEANRVLAREDTAGTAVIREPITVTA